MGQRGDLRGMKECWRGDLSWDVGVLGGGSERHPGLRGDLRVVAV